VDDKKPKFIPYVTQKEQTFLRDARRYARLKAFGITIENNVVCKHGMKDAERLAEYLGGSLLHSAVELIAAMSIDEIEGQLVD
jgi:hypothetical protein